MDSLEPVPTILANQWEGYQHFIDQTIQSFDTLAYPSRNCTIPNIDKIEPDKGKTILGQPYTEDQKMIGNMQKFTTMGGDELEVRVWSSDQYIEYGTHSGTFVIGETVTGGSSGTTGVITSIDIGITNRIFLKNVTANFVVGETITGGTSSATATVTILHTKYGDVIEVLYTDTNPSGAFYNIPHWYQITMSQNPLTPGLHRYSFDQWFDTNIDPAISLNISRLIWVNGLSNVFSWTGGIAPIISMVPNVSITTTAGITWASLGFVDPAIGGNGHVIVNGISYLATGGWSTDTLLISDTTGISVGDVAVARIDFNNSSLSGNVPFDFCRNSKNYMFYGWWKDRRLWMSNAFNRPSSVDITASQAAQNDLILTNDSAYTGIGSHIYKVTIDSTVQPPVQEYSPVPSDTGGNNAVFIGNHTGTNRDFYELVVDSSTTHVAFFFNGSFIRTFSMASATPSSPSVLNNGISVYFLNGANVTHVQNTAFFYTIGGQDTFQYQIDNGTPVGTLIPITGGSQSLGSGVEIQFVSPNGHTVGDYWSITVNQAITDAWYNFYYTLPIRRPGEGFIYRLPSNFWTMDTQEDKLYVNSQFGEWGEVTTDLSSDLESETIQLSPLKQAGALKVIDPWLTGHLDDDLMFVTIDKSLMSIGRKEFLQEPQDGYLSDPVKLDFLSCSFVGGGMRYIGKRLYITSPEQNICHVYDASKKYWQPPKTFIEMGLPSIVENQLIMHSNLRNQSFTMFTNSNGDNGQPYTVELKTPYSAYFKLVARKHIPARWDSKFSSNAFTEGYIRGNPQLVHTVYLGVNGCGGTYSHPIVPIVCVQSDRSPLGEGPVGSHPLGSDLGIIGLDYFNEIYTKYKPILNYYFISLGITCTAENHSYAILSLGVNMVFAPTGNNTLVNRDLSEL